MKPSYRDEKSPTVGLKRAPKRSSNERLCVHACIQQCTRGYTTVYTRVHKTGYGESANEGITSRKERSRKDCEGRQGRATKENTEGEEIRTRLYSYFCVIMSGEESLPLRKSKTF